MAPTAEQIANWQFFLGLLVGVALVLLAVFVTSEHVVDRMAALWRRRRQPQPIDFTEARRRRALDAIVGGR